MLFSMGNISCLTLLALADFSTTQMINTKFWWDAVFQGVWKHQDAKRNCTILIPDVFRKIMCVPSYNPVMSQTVAQTFLVSFVALNNAYLMRRKMHEMLNFFPGKKCFWSSFLLENFPHPLLKVTLSFWHVHWNLFSPVVHCCRACCKNQARLNS